MTAKRYAALLLDLDGTLIGRDQRISPRVADSVREAATRLEVSIASGREPSHVIRFASELALTAPQASDNGALILDPATGDEIWSESLDRASTQKIVERLRRLDLAFLATHPGGTVTDYRQVLGRTMTRVSALDLEEGEADRLVAAFQANTSLHVVKVALPYNGMWAVDFTSAGVHKGTAALHIAERLGVDGSQMIAVGDSYNDLPMLEASGLRIAMGDAPDELKAIADYVAPSVDDDGLAIAIDEFVLPGL